MIDVAMTDLRTDGRIDGPVIAAEAFDVLDTGHQIAPFSSQLPDFSLDDAYLVTAAVRRLREARGEIAIGRKIGFTNRTTWPDYAPMWGYVYDRTVHDLANIDGTFSLAELIEPRIEPEIVFRLVTAPTRTWTSAPCSAASTPSRMALRSSSRSSGMGLHRA